MKSQLSWIGVLLLFGGGVFLVQEIFGWPPMKGVGGLFIMFFLGYCAIILVGQVFSAVAALRTVLLKAAERKRTRRSTLP